MRPDNELFPKFNTTSSLSKHLITTIVLRPDLVLHPSNSAFTVFASKLIHR